jgi:hypothetical protein
MRVSKQRKKARRPRKVGGRRDGPILMRHPLAHIPREELLKGLVEAGESHKASFPEQFQKIRALIQGLEPLQTLATLSCYGLMGGISETGKVSRSFMGDRFNQSHVELTQALVLQILPTDVATTPPEPQQIQNLFDGLPKLAESFSRRRWVELNKERSSIEKGVSLLQEHLRLHTQIVRNWGFFDRVVKITTELCTPVDHLFSRRGVAASALIRVFEYLLRHLEDRINRKGERFRAIAREEFPDGMIRKYYELHPQRESPDELIRFVREYKLGADELKALLISHSDLTLADDLSFSVSKVANELRMDEQRLETALERLSIGVGDLASVEPSHFFLDNPVWIQPLIRLGSGRFFCALPQAFFSFIFPILDNLLAGDEAARAEYQRRRSNYLEAQVTTLLGKAFPGCDISRGYKWNEDGTIYENDLLVRVDSHLIIVEAKSGSISWPALRGAPDRARKHVEELLLAPSSQSFRLARRIEKALASPEKAAQLLPDLPVDLAKVRTVLRLSVTLEDFAVLQSNLRLARQAGWVPEPDHTLAPCILLADLEVIFDVLEFTALKLHYLKRRLEL